jgi:hypothetical protein
MAAFNDKQPIDPVHRLVLGHNQTADVALKLDQCFGRENFSEKGCIMLHQLGKLDQR